MGMKYLALLSGGKDSCYNLVHCARNGHTLIAAASLGPAKGKEEIDSYMYQTVGQDAVQYVADALEVPLYRQVISGDALEQGLEYGARNANDTGGIKGDETEDLYELLSTVKTHHPEIQGVSVGAILSNYQRVRVEHVCRRLALTPLCYLWQRDQGELLAEMVEDGLEAILIKVAGIGLTTKHLGKTLAEMQPTLTKLNADYGAHICGEGGEYETLTLDCPLFKHRIKLTEVETVIHSDSSFATVAYLRVNGATLERKTEAATAAMTEISEVIVDDSSEEIRDAVLSSQGLKVTAQTREFVPLESVLPQPQTTSKTLNSWVSISSIQTSIEGDQTIEEEVASCFQNLQDELSKHNLQLPHCSNINIFLASMDHFARMNAVYATFFGTSPPSRACVAVDFPASTRVRLDCTAYQEKSLNERQALHVQSLSYWAPANIGPYSQSITIDQKIFISGQIGMIPQNLSLPSPPSLALEIALASQHIRRVTDLLREGSGGGWTGHTQTCLHWLKNASDIPHVRAGYSKDLTTPTLFLVVKALPKDALVEKQVLLHTGRCYVKEDDYDDDMVWEQRPPIHSQGGDDSFYWESARFAENTSSCTIVCGKGPQEDFSETMKVIPTLESNWTNTLSIRVFYNAGRKVSFPTNLGKNLPPTTFIPCRTIATRKEDDWDYAMCIMGS